jgi:hypothetical protein
VAKRVPANVSEAGGYGDWLDVVGEHGVWPERAFSPCRWAGKHPIAGGSTAYPPSNPIAPPSPRPEWSSPSVTLLS